MLYVLGVIGDLKTGSRLCV